MGLKSTLKSMALAGMTFAAGLGTYHFAQSKGDNTSDNTKAKTYERSTISHQKQESYELHAGVLMPKAGENQQTYEQRRIRLEKQENLLRQKLAENIRHQLADAQKRKLSSRRIDALEDRLEEHETQAHYISYYTPEGQQKLKVYNENQGVQNSTVSSSASVRRGKTYDF